MNSLIRFVAAAIARFIEKGSPLHAAIGCLVGIGLACGMTYLLYMREAIENWPAVGIASSLAAGLAGGVLGSKVRTKRASSGPPGDTVNVWNLNSALAVPSLVLILGGFFGAAIIADRSKDPTPAAWGWIIIAAAVLLAGLIAAFPVIGLQIGKTVRVLSVFRGREYDASQVRRWGFEASRGEYVTTAPFSTAPFFIEFHDGYSLYFSVSPYKAGQIASLFTGMLHR